MKFKIGKVIVLDHENQYAKIFMERLIERMTSELLELKTKENVLFFGQCEFEKQQMEVEKTE